LISSENNNIEFAFDARISNEIKKESWKLHPRQQQTLMKIESHLEGSSNFHDEFEKQFAMRISKKTKKSQHLEEIRI
jgi:hypothetical protein